MRVRALAAAAGALVCLLAVTGSAGALLGQITIKQSATTGGGGVSSDGRWTLAGTAGIPAVGRLTAGGLELYGGLQFREARTVRLVVPLLAHDR